LLLTSTIKTTMLLLLKQPAVAWTAEDWTKEHFSRAAADPAHISKLWPPQVTKEQAG